MALAMKEQGNMLFRRGKYNAAIDAYTDAILHDDSMSVLYSNRAMCHHKLERWSKAEADARKALSLDCDNLKAMFLLGTAEVQQGREDDGILTLERACSIAERQRNLPAIMKELHASLYRAYKTQWQRRQAVLAAKEVETHEYVNAALSCYLEQQLRAAEGKEGKEGFGGGAEGVRAEHERRAAVLKRLFAEAAERRQEGSVPEYLCGQITMDLMHDPTITPGGQTYERSVIEEHIRKNGTTDPVTRKTLRADQLVPNIALRHATSAFLKTNPWAWETDT